MAASAIAGQGQHRRDRRPRRTAQTTFAAESASYRFRVISCLALEQSVS